MTGDDGEAGGTAAFWRLKRVGTTADGKPYNVDTVSPER